jgi:hypothetical protein
LSHAVEDTPAEIVMANISIYHNSANHPACAAVLASAFTDDPYWHYLFHPVLPSEHPNWPWMWDVVIRMSSWLLKPRIGTSLIVKEFEDKEEGLACMIW